MVRYPVFPQFQYSSPATLFPASLFVLLSLSLTISASAMAQHQHALPKPSLTVTPPQTPTATRSRSKTPTADSAFAHYKRFDIDVPLTDWLLANRTVAEIGGWRAYAKEAARANQVQANPAMRMPQMPATDLHQGHAKSMSKKEASK